MPYRRRTLPGILRVNAGQTLECALACLPGPQLPCPSFACFLHSFAPTVAG